MDISESIAMAMPSIVLILGMHRSGTSSVAELVAKAGYEVPGDPLPFAEEVNARGFWESQQVVDFNERILSEAGLSWFSMQSSLIDISEPLYREILEWLKQQIQCSPHLVIKDPRINILLPIWFRIFDELGVNLKIVFVNRYPDFVASSLEKRDGFSLHTGFALWLKYNWEALFALNNKRVLFVDFEDLVTDSGTQRFLIESLNGCYQEDKFASIIDSSLVRNSKELTELSTDVSLMARTLHRLISQNSKSVVKVDFAKVEASSSRTVSTYYKENQAVLECLDDVNKKLVYARKKMMDNGRLYSEAVMVINEKDSALKENAAYISACHERIADMQKQVDSYTSNAVDQVEIKPLYEQALSSLADSLNREKQTSLYIEMCHSRIAELYGSLRVASERSDKLAVTLMDQERLLRNNNALKIHIDELVTQRDDLRVELLRLKDILIEKDKRIANMEINQKEADDFIVGYKDQIACLNEIIAVKEANEFDARSYIDRCHAQISSLNSELKASLEQVQLLSEELHLCQSANSTLSSELAELKDHVSSLRIVEENLNHELKSSEAMLAVVSAEVHRLNFRLSKIFNFVDAQYAFSSISDLDAILSADFDEFQLIEMARQRLESRQMVNQLLEQQVSNAAEIEALKVQLLAIMNDPIAGLINKKIISRMNHCD